ncbi:DUF4199 domain-containing protein [Aquimarina sp. 2201CG5-10]|uniref:DUF4199 domain-containing protein n=1 Tax=Aquimarina callyspongiae TaxID=3098150 RepID=UPI002AB4AAAA|nr:DUF4199 domain-containing protein [Aquimarina sp. 2201CG5-10]MDY8137236.1 DUF4199 domain-containing protein [Aquimarina sp. 2201CG5-10]
MKNNTLSARNYILKYGFVLGILSAIYSFILYLIGNMTNENWLFPIISAIILIGVINYGIYKHKLDNNGFLKLGNAIKIGIGIVLFGGIITIIWKAILFNVIDPNLSDQMLNAEIERIIANNPDLSQKQLDRNIAIAEKFGSIYVKSLYVLIENLLFGSIISLIGGVIMHKKKRL